MGLAIGFVDRLLRAAFGSLGGGGGSTTGFVADATFGGEGGASVGAVGGCVVFVSVFGSDFEEDDSWTEGLGSLGDWSRELCFSSFATASCTAVGLVSSSNFAACAFTSKSSFGFCASFNCCRAGDFLAGLFVAASIFFKRSRKVGVVGVRVEEAMEEAPSSSVM